MTQVYLKGFGLVSHLGDNLQAAIGNLHQPPAPQYRSILGLDAPVPYLAISTPSSANWYERCEILIKLALDEAGVTSKQGTLYLASSSYNIGAIEQGLPFAKTIPEFLAELAQMLDWQGNVQLINTACTSSLNALMTAQDAITSGLIESAVILGFEPENQLSLAGFAGMQLLSSQAPKPFAIKRDGLVLGEAIAVLCLSKQPSRWRLRGGAQVIDSSQASGASSSAYHQMLTLALRQTQLNASDIDLIKVQAAGSPANDVVEADALKGFFADQKLPALISLKSLLGHTLGAAGAAEIALLLSMIEHGQWPNIRLCDNELDPRIGVNFSAQTPGSLCHLLICNLGFGGSHTCIVIEDTEANEH